MSGAQYIVTEAYGWSGGERKFMREGSRHWIEYEGGAVEDVSAADWEYERASEPPPPRCRGVEGPVTICDDEPPPPWWQFWRWWVGAA